MNESTPLIRDPMIDALEAKYAHLAPALPEMPTVDQLDEKYTPVLEQRQKNQVEFLRSNLELASLKDADRVAGIQKASQETGLPIEIVENNLDQVQRLQTLQQFDLDQLMAHSPVLARQLTDPAFAQIAYDDVDRLNNLEMGAKATVDTLRSAAAGIPRFTGAVYGTLETTFGTLNQASEFLHKNLPLADRQGFNLFGGLETFFHGVRKTQDNLAEAVRGDISDYGVTGQAALSGFESFGAQLPGLLAFLTTGNPAYIYGSAGVTAGGGSATTGIDQGMQPADAMVYGLSDAGVEIATEMIPALRLLADLKMGSPLMTTLMNQLAVEVPQEQLATVLQDLNAWSALPENRDKTLGDYLSDRPTAAYQTLVATITGTGSQTITTYGINKLLAEQSAFDPAIAAMMRNSQRAKQGLATEQTMSEFGALIKNSKLWGRSEDQLNVFVQELFQGQIEEGEIPETVVIGSEELLEYARQQGIDVRDLAPSISEQIDESLVTRGDIHIPLTEYLTQIAASEHAAELNQHIRAHEEAMSAVEAKRWHENQSKEFQQEADRIIEERAEVETFRESADLVHRQIKESILTTERFTEEVSEQYAALHRAFAVTMADRLGVQPHEVYEKYGLQVGADAPDGEGVQYNQSASLRRGTETLKRFGLDPNKTYKTREIAAALENRQRKKYGKIERDDRSKESLSKMAKWMVEEVLFEMQNPERSGVGWYSTKFQTALDTMSEQFPELKDDQAARQTMTALIAITSDGQKVVPNFAQAMDVYGNFREHGKFITNRGHQRQASINNNLKVLQRLYDTMGPELMHEYLMQEKTVSELKKIAKEHGGEMKSDYQAHIKMPMAAVEFGPKLGAFYANLMGSHGYLTMDRWWSRTFNRYRGTLLTSPTKVGLERFKNLIGQPDISDDEAIAATVEPRNAYADRGFKNGTEIERAANTIYKAAFEALEDAPFTAKDRTFMLDVVNRARSNLKRRGHDISVADIQAILWYYEKRLYGELGARQTADISYEEAAERVVSEYTGGLPVRDEQGESPEDGRADARRIPPGEELYQAGRVGQSPKQGSIRFPADITENPSLITLFEGADLSTFLHESGHFFFEVMRDIASDENTSPQIQSDMALLLKFVGVEDLKQWNEMSLEQRREGHEKVARAFEAYLFEGNAPNVEIQGLFQRFRNWLVNVYRSLKELNVVFSDEVRQVFDRMLATDDQILLAEQAQSYAPLFASAEEAGMTQEEWQEYQSLAGRARDDATEELQNRDLRNLRWLTKARSKILKGLQREAKEKYKETEQEVTIEVDRMPIYAAMRFITHGEMTIEVEGKQKKRLLSELGMSSSKLSLPALKEMYGEGPAARWRYLSTGRYGFTAKEGIHPDLIAELFGFTSGDEMITRILEAEKRSELIEGLTEQRVLEKYGDLNDQDEMARAADSAVHNEARTRFVHAELKALTRLTGSRNILGKAARQYAEGVIARKLIKDIRPGQYSSGEAKAARLADQARTSGDLQQAAAHKRTQLLQHYFFRSATKAREEVEKSLRYLKKFNNSGVRKNIDPDYMDQIDALLERFDLRSGVSLRALEQRKSLTEWVESQREMGLEPVIDDRLLQEALKEHYKNLQMEQLRGLVDSVKNIEHLGRLKNQLLTAKSKRDLEAAVDEIVASIEENSSKVVDAELETRLPKDRAKQMYGSFIASHRKLSSLVRQMDGVKDGGALWEILIRPLNERSDQEAVMREQTTERLHALFTSFETQDMARMYHQTYIPQIDDSISHMGRIMVALNWGNEGNRQRIMDGQKWSGQQVEAVLSGLSEQDWHFVQSVWDFIDEYWGEIAAKERRVTGVTPKKVEAATVQTPFGELRGGYFPIKYDDRRSPRAYADAAKEAAEQAIRGSYARSTTRRGHTEARAEKVNRPTRIDFGVIFEHLDQVIHDLSLHEYLIDANRVLGHPKVQAAIMEHYGFDVYRMMQEAIQDVAAGDVAAQKAWEQGINWIRSGTSIAAMGWNLGTALLQPFGLTQGFVRVGTKWVGRGLSRWMRDAASMENTVSWIHEVSPFMRLRAKTMQREINEIRNRVTEVTPRQRILGKAEDSYFWLIAKAQMIADVPVWLGAYEKHMAQGESEDRSIALADQAVLDSQGGGQVKDLAQIQRGGPLMKLWTNFYSFFNTTWNLTAESYSRTRFKDPASVGRFAVDMLNLYTIPSIITWYLREALLKGECDYGTDTECVAKNMVTQQLGYMSGTLIGVRELSSAIQGYYGYKGPAGIRGFAEVANLAGQAAQGDVDEAMLRALNNTAGIFLHYPAGQVQRTVEGFVAIMEGKSSSPMAPLIGPPKE